MTEKFDVEKTRQELELVAKALAGETVLLYVRPPLVKDAAGQAWRNSHGVRIIDIHPEYAQCELDFYWVFLHENAHHVLGHVPESNRRIPEIEQMHARGELLIRSEQTKAEYKNDPLELEANSFRDNIDRLASNRALAMFGDDSISARIRVLKNFHISRSE